MVEKDKGQRAYSGTCGDKKIDDARQSLNVMKHDQQDNFQFPMKQGGSGFSASGVYCLHFWADATPLKGGVYGRPF